MQSTPETAVAQPIHDDPEKGRTKINYPDLYQTFRSNNMPSEADEKIPLYEEYFRKLYKIFNLIIPKPKQNRYISKDEIPSLSQNPDYYNKFFSELSTSVEKTLTNFDKEIKAEINKGEYSR